MIRKLVVVLVLSVLVLEISAVEALAGPPPSKVVVNIGIGRPYYPYYPGPIVYPAPTYVEVAPVYTVFYRGSSAETWRLYATFRSLSLANDAADSLQLSGYYTRVAY